MSAALRWKTFLDKVRGRLHEILAEAEAGLDDIIATEVIDPGPYTSAENEVRGRLFALRDKIGPAWAKLETEFGESLPSRLEDDGRALEDEILEQADALQVRTRDKVIARLEVLATEEKRVRKLVCTRCGAALPEPAVQHRVENVTCTHCQAVNTVRPGPASAMVAALRPLKGAQPGARSARSAPEAKPRSDEGEAKEGKGRR